MSNRIQLRLASALGFGAVLLASGADAQTPQRQSPPAALPTRALNFPAFREIRLPNGMGLVVVENHAHPVADMYLLVRGGSSANAPGKAGTAGLVGGTLTRGTSTRTAEQIAETIEASGGRLNGFGGNDFVGVSASVLADQLPLAFQLVSDVALRPSFPDSEVQTIRQQTESSLRVALGQPGSIASRRLTQELYGNHPYGVLETPETVGALTAADLKEFHRRTFVPGNALLVVAGDVNVAQVEQLARQHFGSWSGSTPARMQAPALTARERTGVTLVHRPGSVQSAIRVGFPGIRPNNPDYYPLVVMNHILGGGSEGRLFRVLREQKGWTYGAYSSLSRPVDTGVLTASTDVRTEVTDSALVELVAQMRSLREEPVSARDLQDTKGYLVGSFPLQIETPQQVASQVATTRLLGLPMDALLRYRERISAVTAADVQRVARKYLTTDRAAIVVVGDAPKVMAAVQRVAPLKLVSVEGQPIDPASLEVRASTERFDSSRLRPGTQIYQVSVQGNPVGAQTVTLARDGSNWLYTAAVQIGPVRQNRTTRWTSDFAPISVTDKAEGQVTGEGTAQMTAGRVRGTTNFPTQPGQPGQQRSIDVAGIAGMAFEGQDDAMLAVADLAVGKTVTIPVFKVATGTVGSHSYRVTGVESVTVPAGTFPAFRVEMTGGQIPMTIWYRQEGPHIPLKYEFQGVPVMITLQSMQ